MLVIQPFGKQTLVRAVVAFLVLLFVMGWTLRHGQQRLDAEFDISFAQATRERSPGPLDDGRSRVVRWRAEFEAFAEQDRLTPWPGEGVVFVGSSSIRLWRGLDKAFAPVPVLNRGFGGSALADSAWHVDRLVLPYRPRLVVVYAGENDIAAGRPVEDVVASYASFVQRVHASLPRTRIVFVSVKPSRARESQMAFAREVNERIENYSRGDWRLGFVDVHSPMLDREGRPRAELFEADALHLNAAGYELWRTALAPYVSDVSGPIARLHGAEPMR